MPMPNLKDWGDTVSPTPDADINIYSHFPWAGGMFWLEKSGVTPARSDTPAAVPTCQETLSCPEPILDPRARNIRGLLSLCLSLDVNQERRQLSPGTLQLKCSSLLLVFLRGSIRIEWPEVCGNLSQLKHFWQFCEVWIAWPVLWCIHVHMWPVWGCQIGLTMFCFHRTQISGYFPEH